MFGIGKRPAPTPQSSEFVRQLFSEYVMAATKNMVAQCPEYETKKQLLLAEKEAFELFLYQFKKENK